MSPRCLAVLRDAERGFNTVCVLTDDANPWGGHGWSFRPRMVGDAVACLRLDQLLRRPCSRCGEPPAWCDCHADTPPNAALRESHDDKAAEIAASLDWL